jgi:nickel/cobalt exporter
VRRALGSAVLALALVAAGAAPAGAHPLGNFSVNHLVKVNVSHERVELRYVLDEAEIPTFQERGRPDGASLAAKRAEVRRRLTVAIDGRRAALALLPGGALSHPPGQGGLPLTRVVLTLRVVAPRTGTVRVHDGTFADRVGWKAIVAEPGSGTAVRSSAPSSDPTDELRSYPRDALSSPLNERSAVLHVAPGGGTLSAPRRRGEASVTTRERAEDGFAGLFADAASGRGVLLLLLLAALGWGALHALSPGHGKAMVAAYLVGTRGTARHAVVLGVTVTVTHTIGVFALGVVTLALSQYVLPEDLYPWLTLVSGLMVVAIGAGVLRSRLRSARGRSGAGGHREDPRPSPDAALHEHSHGHADGPAPAGHVHSHLHDRGHTHSHVPEDVSWRGLLGMGAVAGLIPCPSALVVLLGAISQHEVALGLLLIVAFSLGLAGTLTALGLVVVYAKRLLPRLDLSGRVASALPALSAFLILGVGVMLTVRALPGVV